MARSISQHHVDVEPARAVTRTIVRSRRMNTAAAVFSVAILVALIIGRVARTSGSSDDGALDRYVAGGPAVVAGTEMGFEAAFPVTPRRTDALDGAAVSDPMLAVELGDTSFMAARIELDPSVRDARLYLKNIARSIAATLDGGHLRTFELDQVGGAPSATFTATGSSGVTISERATVRDGHSYVLQVLSNEPASLAFKRFASSFRFVPDGHVRDARADEGR
jgi:hypothetical protein